MSRIRNRLIGITVAAPLLIASLFSSGAASAATSSAAAPDCYSVSASIIVQEGGKSRCRNDVYGYLHRVRVTCASDDNNHYTVDGEWKLVGTTKEDISTAYCEVWDEATWHTSNVIAYSALSSEELAEVLANN